ncbi:1-deoxy-D-xylulose 5-phosphate reductoisomerase [Sedimentisphaera cyanobacteriorum]|uniref:1-deoxy-D-xylulose 5-phosphate reductoisomerase n=1 Tax=Sedimentisphaera cyanobacteriorum TaxID=1940790 RepID=A0A1Q2HMG4_9BACT|nr:1-deoxy-D-xylulose-5-phosphate reductoisomerase [Sedimentisphaera cyanobacteriorum]AQQ08406.1 1-deoxy-D-xylulose 5-phosphate reductoisomerase [Sedimentisphaera cyanobacteriorum]
MPKRVVILGSTGSIGTSALNVIDALGDDFEVLALAANKNGELLEAQIQKFEPKYAGIVSEQAYSSLKETRNSNCCISSGSECLEHFASLPEADIVLVAVVGFAGLKAVLAAAKAGKRIAVANKEPLAAAGSIVTKTAKQYGAELLPVDSEHSALAQCLRSGNPMEVSKLILTASGGPFHEYTLEQIEAVKYEQALQHPRWNMGRKITVDSATMMNKALEVLEARWLFDVPADKIDVLVHPEALVHSMVEFVDGSMIAQISEPDMKLPIQYALTYPERVKGLCRSADLASYQTLTFKSPNCELFPAMRLCYDVCAEGGLKPAVFNAANEAAVALFLSRRISFIEIMEFVEKAINNYPAAGEVTAENIIDADEQTRRYVYSLKK